MNPRCTPGWIFGNHPEDQIPNLLRDSASANTLPADFGQHAPIEPESSSVPLNHRFGKDEDEKLLPVRPHLAGDNPEQFVE